jgi:hypothetical protein
MTTGQPIKVPSDRNKYNNEFMESLRLQIKLNDQNLQANRLYINTGQLPASTQMADTRSTSEKLADVESLKRSIVADLSPVAEPAFAYAIINGVMNSPLNVDNSLFRYLAQNASQLANQLSKKYKFGIAGDDNDVQLLVEFLNDAYSKTKNTFQTIKGYMNSTTNLRQNNTNMQDQIIQELTFFLQRLTQLEVEAIRKYGPQSPIIDAINEGKRIISEIIFSLPNQQQMKQILSDITSESYIHPFNDPAIANITPEQHYDDRVVKLVIEMIEKLPNLDQIRTLINTLEKGIRSGSINIIRQTFISLENYFNEWIIRPGAPRTPFQDALEQFRATFLTEANDEIEEAKRVNRISTIRQIEFQNQRNQRDAKAQRVYVINPGTDPVKIVNGPFQQGGDGGSDYGLYGGYVSGSSPPQSWYAVSGYDSSQSGPSDGGSGYGSVGGYQSNQSSERSYNLPFAQSDSGSENTYYGPAIRSQGGSEYGPASGSFNFQDQYPDIYPDDLNAGYSYLFGDNPMTPNPTFSDVSGKSPSSIRNPQLSYNAMKRSLQSMYRKEEGYDILKKEYPLETAQDPEFNDLRQRSSSGHGIRKKGRGISSDYRDFGINKINHKKLDDGILTLRRKSNTNIPDMPSKRISRKLQKIIKQISGGGLPDYNDLNSLEDNEKDYLHKLISKSNLNDRLSVPAPSKDQEEKDFHQFEVMKGEIMSGNDSKELVKKFKVLILKLSKQNILPKNEVQELLQDLISLGY